MKSEHSKAVLLILPPFASFHAPYISLAVLSAHLQSCRIAVSILNVSPFLVKNYCTPARVATGIAAIRQSFLELNAKDRLLPSEAAKMTVLYPLLNEIEQFGEGRLPAETALQVAAFPFWPDALVRRPLVKLMSPFSIYASADLLRAAGKDYFFTDLLRQELRRRIEATTPLLVGISTVFDEQMPAAMHCARLIKEIAPDLHVAMGGPFVTAHMERLDTPEFFDLVDTLVFDEGEVPLQRLCEELDSGAPDLARVPGIMYRSRGARIEKNSAAPAPDMETLAFADYRGCELDQYPLPVEHMRLAVRLSRGCYWQRCTFCRVNLSFCKNFQQPSIDRVVAEIEHLVHSTGVRHLLFSDESSHPLVLEKVCRRILASGLQIAWTFHTRIDKKLTRERVLLYRQAGCQGFQVGIETFSNRLLQVLDKGITEELVAEVLGNIQGILPVHGYMMVGIPGETEAEANRSHAMVQQLRQAGLLQGVNYSLFQLVPGSAMWNTPEKYGIVPLQPGQGQDLMANVCANFVVTEGMTRETAFHLFIRFTYPGMERWKEQSQLLSLAGATVSCRYPFGYLQESLLDALIYQNDLPFQRWLEYLDQKNRPIVPFRSS